jgi:hypothetical protein
MRRTLVIAILALPAVAFAQEHATKHGEPERAHDVDVLGIPMTRHASGTSWIADNSPMRGVHWTAGAWHLMLHGALFAGYTDQSVDAALVSQNWAMVMASRPLAGGVLDLRGMASLEPLTVGDSYPLLLQTGETAGGEPLIDRQHPHDLIGEAAVRYARPITSGLAIDLYAALAGEPAIGPPTYMHRPSSFANPLAPLGHHMEDSTHISYGVLTAGVLMHDAKLEASWFNGREPDEDRYDLDLRAPDSYAVRASFNPARAWSLSAAYAYLESPEAREPDVSMRRFTYSITHAMRLAGRRSWTSSAGVGQNFPSDGRMTHAVYAETAVDLDRAGTTFMRFEEMSKSGHDFDLPMPDADVLFGTVTVGHAHPVLRSADFETAVGVLGSVAYVDDIIVPRYGSTGPLAAWFTCRSCRVRTNRGGAPLPFRAIARARDASGTCARTGAARRARSSRSARRARART